MSDIDRSVAFYRNQVGVDIDHDTRNEAQEIEARGERPLIPRRASGASASALV